MITETLLRAQEQQQHVNGDQPDDGEGSQRPSTASSNDSEPFEVIDATSVGEKKWCLCKQCFCWAYVVNYGVST